MSATPKDSGDTGHDEGVLVDSIRFPARADQLKFIRARVFAAAGSCGCDDATAHDIVIAIDEACQNVVRHAYAGTEDGEAVLECRRDGDRFVVLLRDFAETVDPATIKPRDLDDLRPGGLGVHLIHEVMDEVTFLPPPLGHGNLLRMSKKIG